MSAGDTIFAVSSGAGRAGVAVVRLSGPLCGHVVGKVTNRDLVARRFSVSDLRDPFTGELIDKAIGVWFPGPRSATGEDMCEFHVHGSEAVVSRLFDCFRKFPGLRLAVPGEFGRRAFANGKMDLVEVEGLGDLLDARTEGQRRLALRQMTGEASGIVEGWRGSLLSLLARVDAAVEFGEEEGIAELALLSIREDLTALVGELDAAVRRSSAAMALRDGIRVVLAGSPNTGKSSLLNVLAGRDAAIVSSRPGTTRDVVEVLLDLDGVPVLLRDTAGLREASVDEIELIGMARTRIAAADADVVVWVWSDDIGGSWDVDPGVLPSIRVRSKADLPRVKLDRIRNDSVCLESVALSAATGEGISGFLTVLSGLVRSRVDGWERAVVSHGRQVEALSGSIRCLNDAMGRDAERLELVAADLRGAARFLGQITGHIDVEDWLDGIFSRFCIGK